ncbi:MAG: hypothetical protein ABJL99_08345 [Aliishimia sp.]
MTVITFVLFLAVWSLLFFFVARRLFIWQRLVVALFFPIVLVSTFFATQAYFLATLGPIIGPSDDGRGFGTAIVFVFAIPLGLAMNIAILWFFLRQHKQSQKFTSNEVHQ